MKLAEKIAKVLQDEVTIDKQIVTERLDKWETHSGQLWEDDVDRLTNQILKLCADELRTRANKHVLQTGNWIVSIGILDEIAEEWEAE